MKVKKNGGDDFSILIDTGSTFSVIKNADMLLNIHDSNTTLTAVTNGGKQRHNMEGDLPGFFEVWYNPKSKLNILAWSDVRKVFRITSDTLINNSIFVHVAKDKVMKFKEVQSGLYM